MASGYYAHRLDKRIIAKQKEAIEELTSKLLEAEDALNKQEYMIKNLSGFLKGEHPNVHLVRIGISVEDNDQIVSDEDSSSEEHAKMH
ncbi:hypothetical protein [Bartonella sp. DGB2]|uniref:hypothetical protein n=1 Tax=Bartonella sp. DGB2 TaxID=3388426 RepID=UPI00398F9454